MKDERRFCISCDSTEQMSAMTLICNSCVNLSFSTQALMEKYNKLVTFIKNEIKFREWVCATNHAVLLDNAEKLLKEIGAA